MKDRLPYKADLLQTHKHCVHPELQSSVVAFARRKDVDIFLGFSGIPSRVIIGMR